MEVFDSLRAVKEGWGDYKQWDQKKRDEALKRQTLAAQTPLPEADAQRMAQRTQVLLSAINTMDTYSLNKSTDVSLVTAGLSQPLVMLGTWLPTIAFVLLAKKTGMSQWFNKRFFPNAKTVGEVAKNFEAQMHEALEVKDAHKAGTLLQKFPKLAAWSQKILDPIKNTSLPEAFTFMGVFALSNLVASITTTLYTNHLEKQGTRVARWQAREQELKDPRNFVLYTEAQRQQAAAIAAGLEEPPPPAKESLNPFQIWKKAGQTTQELRRDFVGYQAGRKAYYAREQQQTERLDALSYTPEALQKAREDQAALLNITQAVEVNSQDYLTSTRIAVDSLMLLASFGGMALSGMVWGGLQWRESRLLKAIEKESPQVAATLKEALKTNDATKIKSAIQHGLSEATGAIVQKNRFLKKVLPGAVVLFVAPILPLLLATYQVKLNKEGAKLGRFKARQDLLNHPEQLRSFSAEEMASVAHLKAPKDADTGFLGQLRKSLRTLKGLRQDVAAYESYKQTVLPQEQKLKEAFKQVAISEEQLREASLLQKKTFHTFEKVDELTQRYQDDTETAVDITEKTVENMANTLALPSSLAGSVASVQGSGKSLLMGNLLSSWPFLVQMATTMGGILISNHAAKIGVMEAMKQLQDERLYLDAAQDESPPASSI